MADPMIAVTASEGLRYREVKDRRLPGNVEQDGRSGAENLVFDGAIDSGHHLEDPPDLAHCIKRDAVHVGFLVVHGGIMVVGSGEKATGWTVGRDS
jgi:hypothetical protein